MADERNLTPNERLARAREKAGYGSASEAARAFGWNENTYRSHENGERGLRFDVVKKYARSFKCSIYYIISGIDSSETLAEYTEPNYDYYRLSGYISSEGDYHEYSAEGYEGYTAEYVDTDVIISDSSWKIEIKSKYPIFGCFPGDLLLVSNSNVDPREYIGKLAIIEDKNGKQILRRIRMSERKNLIDIAFTADLGPEHIEFNDINLIFAVVQSSFWRKVNLEALKTLKNRKISGGVSIKYPVK